MIRPYQVTGRLIRNDLCVLLSTYPCSRFLTEKLINQQTVEGRWLVGYVKDQICIK